VNSQETQTNFTPSFVDVQTDNYQASKMAVEFLGNISQNKYNYQLTRQTKFGTIDTILSVFMKAKKRQVQYLFWSLKTSFKQSDSFTLKICSCLSYIEQEYFDIFAQYRLGVVDSNIGADSYGDVSYTKGIGSNLIMLAMILTP
jgi:hypothetical protein